VGRVLSAEHQQCLPVGQDDLLDTGAANRHEAGATVTDRGAFSTVIEVDEARVAALEAGLLFPVPQPATTTTRTAATAAGPVRMPVSVTYLSLGVRIHHRDRSEA
jgi:hypothetical protein